MSLPGEEEWSFRLATYYILMVQKSSDHQLRKLVVYPIKMLQGFLHPSCRISEASTVVRDQIKPSRFSGWWLNQPHLKIFGQTGNLPQIGVNIKDIWNHHLVFVEMSQHNFRLVFQNGIPTKIWWQTLRTTKTAKVQTTPPADCSFIARHLVRDKWSSVAQDCSSR